jgi:hypothetical protein
MSTSHAPGPWKYHLNVGPTKALIVEADGSTIVEVRNNVHDSRFEANVRVMTAGPSLLGTGKTLARWVRETLSIGGGHGDRCAELVAFEAAIAKVEDAP